MKKRTDWDRVKANVAADKPIPYDPETDPYDPNDEKAVREYWAAAKVVRRRGAQKAPTKEMISIRLSPDVLERFRSSGDGWQTRIDSALREWLETHEAA
jgi:uncharacterized protein (DUF4415 family)